MFDRSENIIKQVFIPDDEKKSSMVPVYKGDGGKCV